MTDDYDYRAARNTEVSSAGLEGTKRFRVRRSATPGRKPRRVSGQRCVAKPSADSLPFLPRGLILSADIIVFVACSELRSPSSPSQQSSSAPAVPSSALHRALAARRQLSSSLSQPSWPGFPRFHGRLHVQSKRARDSRPPRRTGRENCVEVTSGHNLSASPPTRHHVPPTHRLVLSDAFYFSLK